MGVGPAPTPTQRRERLRSLLSDGTLVLPGATDALGVRLIESAGFEAAYATGAGLANAQYGMPDIGPDLPRRGGRPRRPAGVGDAGCPSSSTPTPASANRSWRCGRPDASSAPAPPRSSSRTRRCPSGAATSTTTSSSPPAAHAGQARRRPPGARGPRHRAHRAHRRPQRPRHRRGDPPRPRLRRGGSRRASSSRRRAPSRSSSGSDESCAASRWSSTSSRAARPRSSASSDYRELGFGVVLFANFLLRTTIRAGADALAHLRRHG